MILCRIYNTYLFLRNYILSLYPEFTFVVPNGLNLREWVMHQKEIYGAYITIPAAGENIPNQTKLFKSIN